MVLKKGAKKRGSALGSLVPAFEYTPPPNLILDRPEEIVILDIRLVTWGYLNFQMEVPVSTKLYTLCNEIVKRHGGSINIEDLHIYKEQVHPQDELTNLFATLADLGIEGGPRDGEIKCVIYYDYKPLCSDCPLLLCSPRDYRFGKVSNPGLSKEDKEHVSRLSAGNLVGATA